MLKENSTAIIVLAILVSACSTTGNSQPVRDNCTGGILEKADKNDKSAVEAAADLSAFAKMPFKGNFKAEISRVFNATFQKVPDEKSACAMLNQTYVCIADPARASEYMAFMRETKQCNK